ncbi:hypothetical protein BT96DRAFT_1064536 [Gymnopus androsaceus JB14]|uniref:Rieske domain-containing protein n=1 Tax=Gymnopus androsaceus JB14 TaxID=1447944 RepID=A0A6A4GXB4_9AGAR|nr:hypothetical protein BT96DRAFT_1064536 [Gymnopus androsaceus JB14]
MVQIVSYIPVDGQLEPGLDQRSNHSIPHRQSILLAQRYLVNARRDIHAQTEIEEESVRILTHTIDVLKELAVFLSVQDRHDLDLSDSGDFVLCRRITKDCWFLAFGVGVDFALDKFCAQWPKFCRRISSLCGILSHSRFILTLRSEQGKYHGLILFQLSPASISTRVAALGGQFPTESSEIASNRQIYVMEATCPHLGAEMSHADIEEYEDSVVAVCPWHRYDFDLKTGKSETGLRTCTYAIQVKLDPESGEEQILMKAPEGGTNWRVVELRPVSKEFADPPPPKSTSTNGAAGPYAQEANEPVVPEEKPPKTLMEWAVLILNMPNPTLKVEHTRYEVHAFRTGTITSIGNKGAHPPVPPAQPPRETYMNYVEPGKIQSGKRKNRAVMLHALANIEQWA